MNLHQKIISIYPELATYNFAHGDITLQNDSDGKGDYIAKWEHPTLPRPTDEQLGATE
jgi:hypothetical protein